MRIEGWEKLLDEYLVKMAKEPFEWGKNDCLIFTSDWCKMVRGVDPMSKFNDEDPETIRGMYSSEKEAKDLIKTYRKSARDIMNIHFSKISPNFAQRGDVVFYKMAFGIAIGRGQAVFNTEDKGLLNVKLGECNLAWRI